MTSFPRSPRLSKGSLVLIDTQQTRPPQVINFQYNPDTLNRSLQPQGSSGDGDFREAFRLKGPPIETIKLEAEIDASDQLEHPDRNPTTIEHGIYPQLAALETILYPSSSDLRATNDLAKRGALEIAPLQAPLTLFVWSKNRIIPVQLTECSVIEEAFDPALNPMRARVSLGMRVLSVNHLGFDTTASSLYLVYQQQKEQFANRSRNGSLTELGLHLFS